MRIGIDIDDTTFLTVKSMIKYADIFEEQRTGRHANNDYGKITNRYYLKHLYGWDDETKQTFFNIYYKNVLKECTMLPNANTVIKKLKEDGHTIHFITARLMNIPNCDTEKITKESFKKFNIPYDTLSMPIKDKLTFVKENNIDLIIEDSYETCKEFIDNGMKSILMTTRMNEQILDENIIRVKDWNEIYNIVKNM